MLRQKYSIYGQQSCSTQNSHNAPDYVRFVREADLDLALYTGYSIALSPLGSEDAVTVESDKMLSRTQYGLVNILNSGNMSLLSMSVNEIDSSEYGGFNSRISKAAYDAYRVLFHTIKEKKLGDIIRIWNYVPNINSDCAESIAPENRERYRQFNSGRLQAMEEFGPRYADNSLVRYSASCVGTYAGPLVIRALITTDSKKNIIHMENGRQTPAYTYPKSFGAKSPSFVRATVHRTELGDKLYLSGTASVVNSETLHRNSVRAQTRESIRNISYLISNKNISKYGIPAFSLADFESICVYIRNPKDYEDVKKIIESKFPSKVSKIYLQADICRKDLLVEIEGIATRSVLLEIERLLEGNYALTHWSHQVRANVREYSRMLRKAKALLRKNKFPKFVPLDDYSKMCEILDADL